MTDGLRHFLWRITAGVFVVMLCTSGAGAAIINVAGNPASIPADETIHATESVDIWERAILPLRTNESQAGTSIENQNVLLRSKAEGETVGLNKDHLSVFASDEQIELQFDSTSGADTGKFANEHVDLIVAKLNPDTTGNGDFSRSLLNASALVDNLTKENANQNASFEEFSIRLDGSGAMTYTYDPLGSGHYVFMLAENESNGGLEVSASGNISVAGEANIIGLETAAVQKATGNVDAPNKVVRGHTAKFDVTANLEASQTNHSLVLYDKSAFTSSQTKFIVEGDLNLNQSIENITINHQIKYINGNVTADGNVTIAGTTVNDDSASGSLTVGSIIDFVAETANQSKPTTIATASETLDASAVVVEGGGDSTTLTVQTFSNWSTGTYRYIYASQGDGINDFSTATGTLKIVKAGGGGAPPDDDDDDGGAPPTEPTPQPISKTVTLGNDGSVQVGLSGGFGVTSVSVNIPGVAGQVTVQELPDLPADISEPAGQFVSGVDIIAPNPAEGETATVTISVSQARLDEQGITAEQLVIQHYRDGAWRTLETTIESQGEEVVLTAKTTGFSPFAVTAQETQDTTTTTTTTTTTEQTETTTATPTTTGPETGGGFPTTWLIVGILVIIVAAVAFYLQREGGSGGSEL